ncbi:tetratricopeptide repeat protein [Methylobacterium segetis]|uniref:tetratricopeptide repeat protein n=1 Tax=Methylobacterium segetis TaxID=2488750 RepID=UPI0010506B96|nr:tetratricopeptide repeat protein [Methylobacterium segetis]
MRRRAALAALGLALCLPGGAAEAARLLAAKGSQPDRYGRIALTFDAPVSVRAKMLGTVLVLSYGERVQGGAERLAAELPAYVTTVRRDPDGSGLRLALQRSYRVNVQEAGEQVFIDLLPEGWSGLPPPLPPEVVAELARRVQRAEAALKAATPAPVRKALAVEVAHLPALTRLSLRLPPGTETSSEPAGPATRIRIAGPWRIDGAEIRGRTKPAASNVTVEEEEGAAALLVTPGEGYLLTTERDDDGLTIDLAPRTPSPRQAAALPQPVAPASPSEPGTAAVQQAAKPEVRPAPSAPPPSDPVRAAGDGLVFAFRKIPPAALFERAGVTTLVFETDEAVAAPDGSRLGLTLLGEPKRTGGVVALRFAAPPGRLVDLLPVGPAQGPGGWELVTGETLSPSESLVAARTGAGARFGIGLRLPEPGSATWLDLDGERVAVVTSRARRPAGVAKRQRFVDFELLPSRLGVAVAAQADDLVVRPDIDGVGIGREGGLAVSTVMRDPEVAVGPVGTLAVERNAWELARRGDVRETLRERTRAILDATVAMRGPPRLDLARALLANGLDPEALAVLGAAAADDPVLAGQREVAILSGLASARIGRAAEAKRILGSDSLAQDPEAALWRGFAEAQAGRWVDADNAFRAAGTLVERYPEDLQGPLRAAMIEAAIETGDLESASRALVAVGRLSSTPLVRDRLALLRGRMEEATGQTVAALATYERLGAEGERPVAVAASLRNTLLAQATGKLPAKAAIERLEREAITWHGGETEDAMTAGLAHLYAETGRYREAFQATRRANATAPDSAVSRSLHAEAQALFDDLFLGPLADRMSGVEAVALYFDFKDFAPIGRRGDEIVRRLADRLVGLDLLDSAAELLQHQVDNRLTGAARAGVAARLAAIRLMDGKPLMALEVLEATHLPELPAGLTRARGLIRARALSDLSRTDLALETIEGDMAPDAQRLRADILWGARRWREAGEAHEALLGEVWRGRKPLDDAARADVIRAAIAYDLSAETIGLERLKGKFAGPMSESADARTFALLTAANALRNPGFREIAQRATSAETLAAFLAEYRRRYPETGVPDRGKAPAKRESRAETGGDGSPPG